MPISKTKQIEGSETHHYVSQRKQRGQKEVKMQPPLTPMIDVTFQLLLYFLLTSTFQPDEGQIPGTLPQTMGKPLPTPPLQPIKVVLRPAGVSREKVEYTIDRLPPITRREELYGILMGRKKAMGGSTDIPVVIRPRGDVRWKYVIEVFNAAVHAKFKKIGFAASG